MRMAHNDHIRVSEGTKERLKDLRKDGEAIGDVVERIIDHDTDNS